MDQCDLILTSHVHVGQRLTFYDLVNSLHVWKTIYGFIKKKKMYVSSFHFVSLCFVMSIFQIVWSVTSCFRVFPIYLNRFICYETEMGL